ncbi:MAG: DUF89 family protein [Candidatus Eremiobacteraeota bacterium]|nr:DUF89 family protein [Candidatus Eremiobacteraeota bacterium]
MKIFLDCLPCFVRQALDASRMASDDPGVQEVLIRKAILLLADIDYSKTPAHMGSRIHKLIRRISGENDPYKNVKSKYNKFALSLYPYLSRLVEESDDRFETAVRLAIAGNIIDFAISDRIREDTVHQAIQESLTGDIPGDALGHFRQATESAKSIIYLGDNAGEIVFDRLLINEIGPDKIIFAVKSGPIINDATMEDARAAGIFDLVKVISTGSDFVGTILETCSEDFIRRFNDADLVIAKGQANYETLSDVEADITFLLKVKCPVIASESGHEVGRMVIHNNFLIKRKGGEIYAGI